MAVRCNILRSTILTDGSNSDKAELLVEGSRLVRRLKDSVTILTSPSNVVECHMKQVLAT
eukprot:CAMPEP_0197833240 /NCGR_PEP_ID=MMETSP1437-20131217/18319_1 /TAXON_ID=49252 ORGANISM="Eucampia antarctica, Strain CCMP1452" /NCGR_SAMPLE_ID=MMETSP1437 /ASSEMBLY_ACC=CAM_ASM_001096 /LENGTH=59 /DNA_ID=CAMNT_0043437187 /DNA_START=91 /DNA_END=266 /DNA_ORIENTATION=-